ncbi:MAG: hypothetical protein R3349_00610, partial [Geminicoccaceae bacterium]|nr:hypothetical protein [Geminicoccaceae bacterium]
SVATVDGPPVDLSRSPCLARPEDQITVVPPGRYDEALKLGEIENHTVDMRGTLFLGNPPKRPISFRPTGETCIVGPSIQGQQPRDWTWQRMKSSEDHAYDGDAIGWGGKEMRGPIRIDGAWIDNFEDGLGPPKRPGSTAGRRWSVHHVYARHIRDDFIENDGCIDLEVRDTLVDSTFAFISARPGRGRSTDEAERPAHTVVRDTLVHLQCMPGEFGPENCGPDLDMGQIFKWSDCGGTVDVRDTIFYVDPRDTRRLTFPDGTYDNVTIIWPAEEGARFPAKGGLPEGIELTSDVSLWEKARADWLRRHGCDQDGNNCTYLQRSG